MNKLLGIIRYGASAKISDNDTACFQALSEKFPSAFAQAEKIAMPGLEILCDSAGIARHNTNTGSLLLLGEIYNRAEIAASVGIDSHTEPDDAALVYHLIRQQGINSVSKLNGQFLIIHYDNTTGHIQLANDHSGIQQIVYHQREDFLIFSTEVKFLLAHPDCPKGIDWANALRRALPHLVLASYKSHNTWFKGINLFPEAGILDINLLKGTSDWRTYWKFQDTTPSPDDGRSAEQVMDEYATLLEDAIKIRMAPDATTHSLLSGGLDSSVICGMAVKNGPIETYSIINQTTVLEDTTSYCAQMAADCNFKNSQYLIPYHELCFNHELWKQRVWRAESPVNHTDSLTKTLLHYAISKNQPEVRHLLTGTGSDQMNGGLVGYTTPPVDDKEEWWTNFHNEIQDVENRNLIARNEESLWSMRKFVNRDFVADMAGTPIEKNTWAVCMDGALHSQAYSLLWDEQRASSSHGHITRYPFLDYRIAEFIAAVPTHLHQYLFLDKQILREPAKNYVPDYIVNKPKMPYNLPEYDFRAELYEFLTADNESSLLNQAFGDPATPHPVINKQHLYSRIKALRAQPEIMEWLNIIHIINLGLLEQLSEKGEKDLQYENHLEVPPEIDFSYPTAAKEYLEKRLGVLTTAELLSKPVRFGKDCSLLLDTKSNKYYLSKRNNITYEIDDEYREWKLFLDKIDNTLSAKEILDETGVDFSVIEEFYRLSLKEQILVISDKSPGY
jgi:asparagine synthase (glutamine-hydrolysing)